MNRLWILLTLLVTHIAQAHSVADTQVALNTYLAPIKQLEADFHQQVVDRTEQVLSQSSGKMYVSRPQQFRWEVAPPFEQQIIGDGQKVWVYDKDLEQVTVQPMSAVIGDMPTLLLASDGERILEQFTVVVLDTPKHSVNTPTKKTFVLTPRNNELEFVELKIQFIQRQLSALSFTDRLGYTTHIELSNVRYMANLNRQLFQFTPPPHVDVVEDF